MRHRVPRLKSTQSTREEIANSVSHGAGFLAAMAATPILLYSAARNGGTIDVVGAAVFAGSMVFLYLASTLSHALPPSRARRVFEELDHLAIFLLIAGTYTPFMLGALHGPWGWALLGLVWGLAVIGILLRATGNLRSIVLTVCLYLAMGWLALIAAEQIWLRIPPWGLFWILAGGLAYTLGVGFFAARKIPYNHLIWHIFVLAGSACHYVAIMWYAS